MVNLDLLEPEVILQTLDDIDDSLTNNSADAIQSFADPSNPMFVHQSHQWDSLAVDDPMNIPTGEILVQVFTEPLNPTVAQQSAYEVDGISLAQQAQLQQSPESPWQAMVFPGGKYF